MRAALLDRYQLPDRRGISLALAVALLLGLCSGVSAQSVDYVAQVQKAYLAYYGRPGDDEGIRNVCNGNHCGAFEINIGKYCVLLNLLASNLHFNRIVEFTVMA